MTSQADECFLSDPTGPCSARVIGAGSIRDKRIAIRRRRDRFFTLVLVSRGQGWFESATQPRREVRAGEVLLLFPGEEHSFAPDAAGWDESWVMSCGTAFRALEHEAVVSRARPVLTTGLDEELMMVLRQVMEGVRDAGGAAAVVGARAHLAWCLAAECAKRRTLTDRDGSPVQRAKALIEADLARPLDLASLAAACGWKEERLRKAFAATYGSPPLRWQRERRIAEAKRLLSTAADLELETMARRLGFADASHLAHRFREAVGLSPGAWRRRRLGRDAR